MPQGVREGGRVEITCGSPAEGDGARIRLLVADDRQGVPVDERARIFERIYRVPGTARRGSGIGLSLVARIAESHGGAVEVAAGIEEHGLAVILSFPIWLEPECRQRWHGPPQELRRDAASLVPGAREAGTHAPRAVISA
ncbi:sensor histidine kinase [Burkholderia pyrrocinia]|uniref:sensor histidine kinase n=1 Tax=Burkholderia pyrrocinia TaxID=60550 RepID=UPI00064B9150|nr:ATP-binding protein [Burkholderia pyrrocinia]AKM01303.1 hypothetical protein ABD05_14525 [Burkholderia pyrrocinia]